MFRNCGKQIRIVAIAFFWMMVVSSIAGAIVIWVTSDDYIWVPFLEVPGTIGLSYIFCLFLAGFGELIDNTNQLVAGQKKQNGKSSEKNKPEVADKAATGEKSNDSEKKNDDVTAEVQEEAQCQSCGEYGILKTYQITDDFSKRKRNLCEKCYLKLKDEYKDIITEIK